MHRGTSVVQWIALLIYFLYETCYGIEDIPVSSFGTNFYLTIPEVEARGDLNHLVCFSSSNPASIAVTSLILVPTQKKANDTVDISVKKSGIYNLLYLTRSNDGIPIKDILFNITSNVSIGVTLFVYEPGWLMASFVALPVNFWGHEYVFVGLRNSHTLHIINIHESNEISIICKEDDIKKNITDLKSPGVNAVTCIDRSIPALETKLYKVILLQGKKPFGLLISYSSYPTFSNCTNGFLALDMPTSTRALGTEFFILGSPLFLWKCELVIMSTQPATKVTFARKGMDNQEFRINKALSLLIIPTSTITRKLTSSEPVQATLFLRSPCKTDSREVGEISLTILVPTVLFYNIYVFCVPHTKDAVSQMVVFIHISGVASLVYNNEPLISPNWTRIVGAQNWLTGQTIVVQDLNRISSRVRFGCYVFSMSSTSGYIHSAGFEGNEQCGTESNSTCVGNIDYKSLYNAAYPKRNISSFGSDFLFVVGQGSRSNERNFYEVSMMTTSRVDMTVQIITKYRNKYETHSTVMKVKPKQTMVFNLSQYSEGVRKGVAFEDMVFMLRGTASFSLSVVIETKNKTMTSFVALPLEYWDREYIAFGIRANPVIIVINLYFENTIDVHCGNTRVTDRVSGLRALQFEYITFCFNISTKNVSGVSLYGMHEFGVIVLETTELRNDSCSANGTFLGQDMTMPVEAFGKDFVTINGHHKDIPGDLIVVSVYNLTAVTLYREVNRDIEVRYIRQKFDSLEFTAVKGGRRLISNKPVQAMFVIRLTCDVKSSTDVAYTLLMPDHLLYNEYYIGNPNIASVTSMLNIVIHNSGIHSVRTDNTDLSSVLEWEIVAGKPSWRLGHGDLPLQTTNHITAEIFFACYVYSYKDKASSLQVAGYKSCLSLSVALRPEECYVYSIQSEASIAGIERLQTSFWLISILLLVYHLCSTDIFKFL